MFCPPTPNGELARTLSYKRHSPKTEGRKNKHKDSGKSWNENIGHFSWTE